MICVTLGCKRSTGIFFTISGIIQTCSAFAHLRTRICIVSWAAAESSCVGCELWLFKCSVNLSWNLFWCRPILVSVHYSFFKHFLWSPDVQTCNQPLWKEAKKNLLKVNWAGVLNVNSHNLVRIWTENAEKVFISQAGESDGSLTGLRYLLLAPGWRDSRARMNSASYFTICKVYQQLSTCYKPQLFCFCEF